jgi:hypothetical protein
MDKVVRLDRSERSALFGETGAARGVADTIIEKDFWVCWPLKRLFELQKADAPTLVFKGGTSLSKAFGAIRRFSADIDLSFDRADLGYTGDPDPGREGSAKSRRASSSRILVGDVEKHIAEKLLPALRAAIAKQLGEPTNGEWSPEIDPSDSQTVNFHYPTALPKKEYEGMAYITPRVKLEFGARGDPWPTEEKTISLMRRMSIPTSSRMRIAPWPCCRRGVPSGKKPRRCTPRRTGRRTRRRRNISRGTITTSRCCSTAKTERLPPPTSLCSNRSQTKVFFRSAWASYDTARPSTLQLVPSEARLKDLRADYRDTASMMFDEKPLWFDEILARIQKLQDTINASPASQ